MVAIMKYHKNAYHDSTIQDGDLHKKTNTTKFGSIFSLSKLLAILTVILDVSATIQDRNLQQKSNTTKFGSIFDLNMLSAIFLLAIFDASHY